MRRAALICSNDYLRDMAIDEMVKCFKNCGYKEDKLMLAKDRVQSLDRRILLSNNKQGQTDTDSPLVCVLPHSVDNASIKQFINSFGDEFEQLTGSRKILFSFRRNRNLSSLLFNKYGFAQLRRKFTSQRCGSRNCGSCKLKLPNLNPLQITPNFTIKPSESLNCKSECVIYAAICKLCKDFYFGKTINEEHTRMNGHRDKFCPERYDKSALSMHLYTDHQDHVGNNPDDGLSNYNVVILETTNASNLRRRESFYIWSTDADIKHLNRYKVL